MVYNVYERWMNDNNADQISIMNESFIDHAPYMPPAKTQYEKNLSNQQLLKRDKLFQSVGMKDLDLMILRRLLITRLLIGSMIRLEIFI